MNEPKFAEIAIKYVKILNSLNNMKPSGWSQEDHTRECNERIALLKEAREALKE